MKCLIALLAFVAVFMKAEARTYCATDTHCEYLGKLYCVKGQCDYGICGCHRGMVAKYLGSEGMFRCVPLKKVGEKCSTDWDAGVCGAPNSYCVDGYCTCATNYVSIWGGEYCTTDSQQRVTGESCSPSVGNCQLDSSTCLGSSYSKDEIQNSPRSCACGINQKIYLYNHVNVNDFIGKKVPVCGSVLIDDYCWHDSQCPTGAVCTSNKCTCATLTPVQANAIGSFCTAGTALGAGTVCLGTGAAVGTCNGANGLQCGDACDITDPTGVLAEVRKCSYVPYFPGGSKAKVGSSCFGDHNCMGLGMGNGICVDGTCENAGVRVAMSLSALFCVALAALLMH